MRILRTLPATFALLLVTGSAFAAADLVLHPRVFNDVPGAAINMTASGSTASVTESNVSAPTGFANHDEFLISEAGGAPATFDTTDAFAVCADVNLSADPTTPRKEAGIILNNPVTGNAQFIVNSDAHEVVAFGGGAPFWNAVAAGATPYDVGQPITLCMAYGQKSGVNGVTYTVTQNGNTVNSGFKPWENNEQGIGLGTNAGFYFQIVNDPNNPTNSGGAVFSNIKFARGTAALELINATPQGIPEPGTMALLGAGLLPLLGLRRRK